MCLWVSVFDLQTFQEIYALAAHVGEVLAIDFSRKKGKCADKGF